VNHDGALCCHFVVVEGLIMVPPTIDSSARRRVNKHAVALGKWIMMALLLTFGSCGKAHHGAANPKLLHSLSEFTLCFPRHSEAEWMLRTDLA